MDDSKALGTKISVRIGRSGTKVHPAYAEKLPNGRFRITMFACHCTGTANGSSLHKAEIVAEGWAYKTCGS